MIRLLLNVVESYQIIKNNTTTQPENNGFKSAFKSRRIFILKFINSLTSKRTFQKTRRFYFLIIAGALFSLKVIGDIPSNGPKRTFKIEMNCRIENGSIIFGMIRYTYLLPNNIEAFNDPITNAQMLSGKY